MPFLWNVLFTVLSHELGTVINANLIFGHEAAQNRPWTWAVIHGVAVLAACVGVIIFWQHTEKEQQRNVQLVADLAAADAQRQAMSELLVNLARRNQSLLNRQLEVITDLEVRERQPDVLEELFRLDHLATRIRLQRRVAARAVGRRPGRRWGKPVPLADVVRAAAAEVEDFAGSRCWSTTTSRSRAGRWPTWRTCWPSSSRTPPPSRPPRPRCGCAATSRPASRAPSSCRSRTPASACSRTS